MPNITISVDNSILTRVLDAIAYQTGWTAQVLDENGELVNNPVTKTQNAKRYVKHCVKDAVISYEARLAAATQVTSTDAEVEAKIT